MKTGFGAVQDAIEKSKSQSSGYLSYFIWKDDRQGEGTQYEKTLRFLTDDVVPCQLYEFIPCIDGKKRDFIVPESVGVDGPDWIQAAGVKVPKYGQPNTLITPKARSVTIGLAVQRVEEPAVVGGRKVLTYRDKMEEVTYEKDGKTVTEERPVFGIVKQSNNNFWGTLAGYWSRYGTITDRDYLVSRRGNSVDTSYTIIPCDPVEELRDPEALSKAYNPPITLEEYVKSLASPERAKKFLVAETGSNETPEGEKKSEEGVVTPKDSDYSEFRQSLIGQSD